MSKSSIEISIKRNKIKKDFDENFGLGAKYVCCEEVDFLINNFSKGNTSVYTFNKRLSLKKTEEQAKPNCLLKVRYILSSLIGLLLV